MPRDFPPEPPRPRKAKKAKGSSGKGNGTTVGMSVLIFGSAFVVITGSLGWALWMRFVA